MKYKIDPLKSHKVELCSGGEIEVNVYGIKYKLSYAEEGKLNIRSEHILGVIGVVANSIGIICPQHLFGRGE